MQHRYLQINLFLNPTQMLLGYKKKYFNHKYSYFISFPSSIDLHIRIYLHKQSILTKSNDKQYRKEQEKVIP